MPPRLETGQLEILGTLPDLLIGSARSLPNLIMPPCVDNWQAHPDLNLNNVLVGQVGLWQEYRQNLKVKAQSLYIDLQSLETLHDHWLTIGNPSVSAAAVDPTLLHASQQTFSSYSFYQPYTPSAYCRVVQDELLTYVVGAFVDARAYLEKALKTFRERIRLVSVLIAILRVVAFLANIFCSVRWEKRRWFLFHGARPPKSPQQVMWACLPEACSGSALD